MSHRETYPRLLSPENRAWVLESLREQGYFETLHAIDAHVVDAPTPYVRLTVADNDRFTAFCTGTQLDLERWPDLVGPLYFPVLAMCPSAPKTDLAHELRHLCDLLELVERDPTYPDRAARLAFHAIGDDADLELLQQSIDFEVFKIFRLEPHAHRVEYEMGRTTIEVPLLFGMVKVPLRCDTVDEFVSNWLANYVSEIEERYRSRFPAHAEPIAAAVRAAVDRHGAEMFGSDAAAQLETRLDAIGEKALAESGLGASLRDGGGPPGLQIRVKNGVPAPGSSRHDPAVERAKRNQRKAERKARRKNR